MDESNGDETKTCPFCAETIKAAAIVCKHCGRDLNSSGPSVAASRPAQPPPLESTSGTATFIRLLVLFVVIPVVAYNVAADYRSVWVSLAFVVLIAPAMYFLPAYEASARGHRNAMGVFLLNLLLGWTVLGWIAALIWAVSAPKSE